MTIDAEILSALRSAGESAVSGADLAARLGISRAAIWARIEDLRRAGYEIHANPHDGYRLRGTPDRLHSDDLLALLGPGRLVGRDIRVFEETTSTNEVVDKFGRDGVKEGVVVFAESQTRGRGRLGRQWLSPKGNGLWFSVLLRPALSPQAATQITVAAAAALARAIRVHAALPSEIKWPNDILVRERKVCGILTEMSAEVEKINYIVLGIGVDVNFEQSDFPLELRSIATSLRIEAGAPIRRPELAAEILRCLDAEYARLLDGRFNEVAEEWESHCTTIGRNVEIMSGPRVIAGRAESLDSEGALLVRTEHGRLERIIGGDVTLKK